VGDLAVYARLAGSRVRAQFSYRLSFVLQIVGAFFLSFLDFVAILVIFQHLPRLAHWSLYEVAFLYGSSYLAFKAGDVVMGNIDKLPTFIRMGSFDQVLTRPIGTLGQVICADVDIRHLGGITQGAIVLTVALQRLSIAWTPARALMLVVMIFSAFVIFCSIWVATNAIAFWTMDAREVANAATYGGNFLTQFPMNLYGVWMRRLFGYVIPLAFVNYYPSLYILGKDDPNHGPHVLRFVSPLVAVGCAVVAGAVWRLAVRRYRSTGS
jgi:ABC-2 type transport system permease protein